MRNRRRRVCWPGAGSMAAESSHISAIHTVAPGTLPPRGRPPSSDYSDCGSHKYGRLAHEREVDAAHPQPVDVTGWVEAQSAVESASETHGDAIE